MANKQLLDFLTAENDLDGNELVYIAQSGKTRKSTLQKIKEFIIGTATLLTTDKTPTGAINELNKKIGNVDVENDGDIATHLNARMKNILSITRNIEGKTIKIFGDSIVVGNGSSDLSLVGETIYGNYKSNIGVKCWAGQLKTYLETKFNCTVKNYGISGIDSTTIVNQLSDLIKSTDDIIICMIGKNNRNTEDGIIRLKSDLVTIYNYAKNLGKEIIFLSPPPALTTDENTRKHDTIDVDNAIMQTCSNLNIEYISIYKSFIEYLEENSINLSSVLSDKLHPNDKGYNIIYNLVLNKLGFADRRNVDNMHDTGWETITLTHASATGTLKIRRIGVVVYFYYEVTLSEALSVATIASIPSGFSPTTFPIDHWGLSTSYVDSGISIAIDSTIKVKNTSATRIKGTLSWTID